MKVRRRRHGPASLRRGYDREPGRGELGWGSHPVARPRRRDWPDDSSFCPVGGSDCRSGLGNDRSELFPDESNEIRLLLGIEPARFHDSQQGFVALLPVGQPVAAARSGKKVLEMIRKSPRKALSQSP